ncbi:MAG: hypothetical protein ACWA5L_10335 [bacterium]
MIKSAKLLCLIGAVFAMNSLSVAAAMTDKAVPGTEDWKKIYAVDPASSYIATKPSVNLDQAMHVSVGYKGKLAGLDIGRIWIDTWLTDNAYRIKYKMEQQGIARWFSNASAQSDSWGLLGPEGQTALYYYNYDYEGDDDYQYVEMTRESPNSRFRLFSEPEYQLWHPVDFDQAKDTVDPMSALIQLGFINVPTGQSPCNRLAKVFDGRRRFNMYLSDAGQVQLNLRGKGRYSGPAWRCAIKQEKLAGYREKDLVEKSKVTAYVFLAQIPTSIASQSLSYMPVYLEGKSKGIKASLTAKYPKVILADGTEIHIGNW